jgi:hypothetical protein
MQATMAQKRQDNLTPKVHTNGKINIKMEKDVKNQC